MSIEASFYHTLDNNRVQCDLCPNHCLIEDGESGTCSIRVNSGGSLLAAAYGEVVSLAVDPMEKKPLYHFYPGRNILSTGPNGCNFRCGFCQNAEISQGTVPTRHMEPETLADLAKSEETIGIAYTYTEPFIWFEYIRDAGKAVHDRGMVNVLVTNGYVNEAPLRELLPVIDAMNIDVKSMSPEFYRKVCGGRLEDVLRTVEIAAGKCHVEVTNLIIPGYNDGEKDIVRLVEWLAGVNPSIPLHFSRYYPRYLFDAPQTPFETLQRAYEIASEKLHYVYVGNVALKGTGDTHCPACGNTLIIRSHYSVHLGGIRDGVCSSCGVAVAIAGVTPE